MSNVHDTDLTASNLYDRATRTFVDGDTFIIGKSRRRLGTMLKRRRGAGRRTAPRAYSTRPAAPRPERPVRIKLARLRLELAAMKESRA